MNTLIPLLLAAVGQSSPPALTCDHAAAVVIADLTYAACGTSGVGVFAPGADGAPVLRRLERVDGEVVGVHTGGGRIWAELLVRKAQPIALGGPAQGASPAPAVAPPPPPSAVAPTAPEPKETPVTRGRVVEVGYGHVMVDIGVDAGVVQGDHVELFVERLVEVGGGEQATEEDRLAVGVVTAASQGRARVRLGRNERVDADALARPTTASRTGSIQAPPRVDGVTELAFMVRPFLALNALGFGAVSELRGSRRWENGFTLHAAVEPLGLGFADKGDLTSVDGHLVASFDTRLFELGFGAGWATISGGERGEGSGSGLSIRQLGRLGARDGLHLEIKNSFLLYDDAFRYGGTVGTLSLPLTERFALFGRGGGGVTGFGFGELGLRLLARGNGDRGSLLVDATIGGAGLFGTDTCTQALDDPGGTVCDSTGYGGPMIGFGVEWRR